PFLSDFAKTQQRTPGIEPKAWRHSFHDSAYGLPGPLESIQRAGRYTCRKRDSEPESGGDRRADWFLCEHTGAEKPGEERDESGESAGAGERDDAGSVCTSGCSV